MGSSESSQTHSEGSLDGNPVTFAYQKGDISKDEGKLSWTNGYKVYPDSQWHHVVSKNIVAVGQLLQGDVNGKMYVVYVHDLEQDESQEAKSFSKNLKVVEISNPPQDLLHDFQFTPPRATCLYLRFDYQDEKQINFHVVVSTGSGTGLAEAAWKQLVKPMLDYVKLVEGKDYELHITQSEDSIAQLTETVLLPQANRGVPQSVIVLSGDGGLLDILNTLLAGERSATYAKPNVALIPLGTGNALAHSTGITADNTLGVRTWISGTLKDLPYFQASFSPGARIVLNEARDQRPLPIVSDVPTLYGAVVCSWAFHAALVADSDTTEYRKFGNERFKIAAKENLYPSDGSPAHVYRGVIKVKTHGKPDWQDLPREEHMYVLATLVSTLEEGFTISPASKPLDGKLRLVHFGPMTPEEAMGAMMGAYQGGKHVEDKRIGYEEIEALRIEFLEDEARWRRICIDGKIVVVEQGGWVEVRKAKHGVVDLISRH